MPEDYAHYRETQGWLHLNSCAAGLAIITNHPGFYNGEDQLAAVLMRTSPSCRRKRLCWENAGEQVYNFTLLAQDANCKATGVIRDATQILRSLLAEQDGSPMLSRAPWRSQTVTTSPPS